MAVKITRLASKIYEQGSTPTVKWALGNQGITDNEVADSYAKRATEGRTPDNDKPE